ncbi:MAG: hypothetical protein MRJ93_00995 [Nitrososphaeraceae archaeon]|nr:hypothetical protein [Nitrososphaeraceae archaeon]
MESRKKQQGEQEQEQQREQKIDYITQSTTPFIKKAIMELADMHKPRKCRYHLRLYSC